MNESIKRLEEKIAYLERHVTEQDKAMLELVEQVEALRRELKGVSERSAGSSGQQGGGEDASDERPPHY